MADSPIDRISIDGNIWFVYFKDNTPTTMQEVSDLIFNNTVGNVEINNITIRVVYPEGQTSGDYFYTEAGGMEPVEANEPN